MFRAVTYNILATAYLARGSYRTDTELLRPAHRVPALLAHIQSLDADLICLQEVEPDVFAEFENRLSPVGYAGSYAAKGGGRPDGCATFFRTPRLAMSYANRLEYHDCESGPDRHSGSIAQLMSLEVDGRRLGVANTHLRWDRDGTPEPRQIGLRQISELLTVCGQGQPPVDGWIVCGDLNCTEDSNIFREMTAHGFRSTHAGRPGVRSSVANGKAKLIDFIFHTAALTAGPLDPPSVSDDTILPSENQPSDHLALVAEMNWINAGP